MEVMGKRFWLWRNESWNKVSKEEYVKVERQAGFQNPMGQPHEPGTAAFRNGSLIGTTLENEIEKPVDKITKYPIALINPTTDEPVICH